MGTTPTPEHDIAPVVSAGDPAPDFDLAASGGRRVSLAQQHGHPFVLYFYPKADTSGCTREACDFQAALTALGAAGAASGLPIIGISRDPMKAIEAFAAKYHLDFPLASDPEGGVVMAYGAWVQKSMYGRSYMGIDRSTFLIDGAGRIARSWRKVKVPGHAAEVIKTAGPL